MSDSILDKVLLIKEDQEKQDFHPMDVVNVLFNTLSTKEADILRRRFGLMDAGKETLETIGAVYGVTRERIRQIENQSIQKIKESSSFAATIRPVEHVVLSLLSHHGGVMTEEMLFEQLLTSSERTTPNCLAISFILSYLLNTKIVPLPKSKLYRTGWRLQLTSIEFMNSVIDQIHALISEQQAPMSFDNVFEALQQTDFYKQHESKLSEEAVLSYMNVSARLAKNPFDEYGLAESGLIIPKRMNDRVYLVLKKEGKPMHFEEIAKRISKVFKRQAYPPTVHNELILNKEYVLVGRGIYALAEWGYKDGVVANVIADVLSEAAKPLTRNDIVDRVLQQRIVKKNTIHLALTDKRLFHKHQDGTYSLAVNEKSKI